MYPRNPTLSLRSRSSSSPKDISKPQHGYADSRTGRLTVPSHEEYPRSRSQGCEPAPAIHHALCTALTDHPPGIACYIKQKYSKTVNFKEFLQQFEQFSFAIPLGHIPLGHSETTEADAVAQVAGECSGSEARSEKVPRPDHGRPPELPKLIVTTILEQDEKINDQWQPLPELRATKLRAAGVNAETQGVGDNLSFSSAVSLNSSEGKTSGDVSASQWWDNLSSWHDESWGILVSDPDDDCDYSQGDSSEEEHGVLTESDVGHQSPGGHQSYGGAFKTTSKFQLKASHTGSGRSYESGQGQGSGGNGDQGRVIKRPVKKLKQVRRRFPCVYHNSNEDHETADCGTRKEYVSQLRRHHERHKYFYCAGCFAQLRDEKELESHVAECMLWKCVKEGCYNYSLCPAILDNPQPCEHGRHNPQKDQWRYLFRMARPHDPIPELDDQQQVAAFHLLPALGPSPIDAQQDPRSTIGWQDTENASMASPLDEVVERGPAIAQLSAAARSMSEISQSMEIHSGTFNEHTQRSVEWVLAHTRLLSDQLHQLFNNFRPRRDAGSRRRGRIAWPEQPAASSTVNPSNPSHATARPSSQPGFTFTPTGVMPQPTMSQPSLQIPLEGAQSRKPSGHIAPHSAIMDYHSTSQTEAPTFSQQTRTPIYRNYDPRTNRRSEFGVHRGSTTAVSPQGSQGINPSTISTYPQSGSDFSPMSGSQDRSDEA